MFYFDTFEVICVILRKSIKEFGYKKKFKLD